MVPREEAAVNAGGRAGGAEWGGAEWGAGLLTVAAGVVLQFVCVF